MIDDLTPLLPAALNSTAAAVLTGVLVFGFLLWVAGALISRAVVTLFAVALGAAAGMLLPRVYPVPMDPMSLAVIGSILLGATAYAAHRFCVGLTLGIVLAGWSFAGSWVLLHSGPWKMRDAEEIAQMTLVQHTQDIWNRLNEDLRHIAPIAAGTALVSAIALAMMWPRIGRSLMSATLGLTLMFIGGLALAAANKPDWLAKLPPDGRVQAAALVALAAIGTLLNWQFLPVRRKVPVKEPAQLPKEQQLSEATSR